jgi:hypothetical protein
MAKRRFGMESSSASSPHAGSLVWECAHVQLASSDAKYPFEQLQIVTRSESSRNIPRPPDADRSLGEAVAKLGVCV